LLYIFVFDATSFSSRAEIVAITLQNTPRKSYTRVKSREMSGGSDACYSELRRHFNIKVAASPDDYAKLLLQLS